MSVQETAYKVIKYTPNGLIDPEWDLTMERALWRGQFIGDVKTANANPIARKALINAMKD
jgi:hypothetical protein